MARSSTEAKYRALANAATYLVWIQNLKAGIGVHCSSQIPVFLSDNMGAQALACNPVYHARKKHIELDVHFVRNLISDQKLEVRYVPTELQPTDFLTKALPQARFMMLRSKLIMSDSMPSLRCDAPKSGGPLTTRQPAEYSWMSCYPTPLPKIGQSLLCMRSSTQGTTYPNNQQRPHRVYMRVK